MPSNRNQVNLRDLKNCKMAHVFFDTFFNVEKYLDHEQKDPFAPQKVRFCRKSEALNFSFYV